MQKEEVFKMQIKVLQLSLIFLVIAIRNVENRPTEENPCAGKSWMQIILLFNLQSYREKINDYIIGKITGRGGAV